MINGPVIVVVPRSELPEHERVQLLLDDHDQPVGLRIREGTIITHDLADLINAVAADRWKEPISPQSSADLDDRTDSGKAWLAVYLGQQRSVSRPKAE